METMEQYWNEVEVAVKDARLIAWDTCHKIYLAMDSGQERWFRENYAVRGSDFINGQNDEGVFVGTPEEMLAKLHEWWNASCGLRFISAVETNNEDPNEGFTTLIPQGAGEEQEDEDEEDEWKEWY